MRDLIIGTFDHLMLIELSGTLKTEGVSARQRNWFLVIVVVRFETNTTFKYLIHFLSKCFFILASEQESVWSVSEERKYLEIS